MSKNKALPENYYIRLIWSVQVLYEAFIISLNEYIDPSKLTVHLCVIFYVYVNMYGNKEMTSLVLRSSGSGPLFSFPLIIIVCIYVCLCTCPLINIICSVCIMLFCMSVSVGEFFPGETFQPLFIPQLPTVIFFFFFSFVCVCVWCRVEVLWAVPCSC